ncbi:MAG TPA: Crp/Fnr family transcriptional regulator [Pyrinomonadaceae bacterium]|nr:Crp/Fnr family transcriptional regulator [Pyrinomonadaceae bacterium]
MEALMNHNGDSTHPQTNRILSALPKDEYERLAPHLEYVEHPLGKVLYEPGEPIHHAHFPYRGTISVTLPTENGSEAEVGVIGREGMFGLPVVLGTDSAPLRAMVQVPGGGVRLRADLLKAELSRGGQLNGLLLRYAQAFFVQTAVTAACNRLHDLQERLAKWLLTTRDRAQSDKLQLTHEFLSVMLGVRRAGVTVAAGQLQSEGLIEYTRGAVKVADARGLEGASCECYQVVRREYDRLLGEG